MNNRYTHKCFVVLVSALLSVLVFSGCRGQKSTKPPIHLVLNMDNQEKFRAFGENTFYPDGRAMRPLIPGTVPRGHLNLNEAYYNGIIDSVFVNNPVKITPAIMTHGQDRFAIYCTVCHGALGDGNSIMKQKGFTPSPSYTDPRILGMKDGQIFDVITRGVRTMPAMSSQVPVADRWAIVAYVRALQKSGNASLQDVPPDKQGQLK
ncbi:MAG: cytochrome c [Fibrobacteria bacterium]|nr:cytochrome c [Fibrobacteria bacterium]